MSTTRTRDVGILLVMGADALFYLGLFTIYLFVRSGLPEWPDHGLARVASTMVALAVGSVVIAALLLRARYRPALPTAACFAALALLAAFWQEAAASGLRVDSGRYGTVVYGLTLLWGVHVGLLGATGLVVTLRDRRGAAAPFATVFLGRLLALQAAAGAVLLLTVFWF